MDNRIDDIQDDELRVIGRPTEDGSAGKPNRKLWFAVSVAALFVIVAVVIFWPDATDEGSVSVVFDQSTVVETPKPAPEPIYPLGDYSDTTSKAYTEHLVKVVNDIPLDIYIPHNAKASLSIGTPNIRDRGIVLVTQAADIRADNGKINGAFVLEGKPLAWGLSKKGYVAIIGDKITVGVADNSPFFEEATETGGCFFRQYALVDNGVLVENEPKNKAIRKAICDRAGEIMMIMSQSPESFHDFAQALVDLRVTNAVYLVGSMSYGYFRDKSGALTQICQKRRGGYKYENYIEWR